MKYLKYLKYVLKHKYFVMIECWKVGLIWQGIVHDLSKLLPNEFIPYANFFYGKKSDISKSRDKTGYYKPTDTGDEAFDYAWLLHQKRNKHHWQWWILPEDDGGNKILEMPWKYRKEMVCDWRGAGKAQGNKTGSKEWYLANFNKMQLGEATRMWVEITLGISIKRINKQLSQINKILDNS